MTAQSQIRTPRRAVRRAGNIASKAFVILLMSLVTLMILYPLLFVLTTAFKTYSEFVSDPFGISFAHPENFAEAWVRGNFGQYFFNSVLVAVCAICGQVFFTALISFAIGTLRFKGSGVILFALLSTMFFTSEMTSIPQMILIREMGLYGKLGAVIFPAVFGPPGMSALLVSNYMKKIPKELHEAAVLDGAGILRVFLQIDFPLARSMLSLVAILCFNGIWSDFLWPLIVLLPNESAWTLPLGLMTFQSANNSDYGVLCAGLCILTAPLVLFYACASKYFIKGVAAGAVKG